MPSGARSRRGAEPHSGSVEKPVLFLVHDDGAVLDALADDLGRRFGADYRVIAERAAAAALATLERLAGEQDVALLIAARHLAGLSGIDVLARAHQLHPAAKRVLLVDRGEWTSGEPVVRALTLGRLDFVLFRPWFPVEQNLYPSISEFLASWDKSRVPREQAVRIVGPRWSPRSHTLRELFARVSIPFGFYPDDSETGRRLLAQSGEDGSRLPVVIFSGGQVHADPSDAELAEALGLRTRPASGACELLVVGAGPAGLAAAVYGASEGLETLVLEPAVPGGQAGTSSLIRNYLGFPRGISGEDLTVRAFEQAWLFGADFVLSQRATGLAVRGPHRLVRLSDGSEVAAKAVIVATGVAWRRLDAPGLEALRGAGVFYGAAGAEARALRGQDVFVVGAGNSAGQAAAHLARHARSVTILTRDTALTDFMSDYLIREIEATPNITVRLRTQIVEGHGRGHLEALTIRDNPSGATGTVPAAAVFILIGAEPRTDWLSRCVRDEQGYVLTGRDLYRDGRPPPSWPLERLPLLLETSVPGVFAAGDVRHGATKRVASAVGEGAIAVRLVQEYLGS